MKQNGKIATTHFERHRYHSAYNVSKRYAIPPFAPCHGDMLGENGEVHNRKLVRQPRFQGRNYPLVACAPFTPDSDTGGWGPGQLFINGPTEIPPGGWGKITDDWPAIAMVETEEPEGNDTPLTNIALYRSPLWPNLSFDEDRAADALGTELFDQARWQARLGHNNTVLDAINQNVFQPLQYHGTVETRFENGNNRALVWVKPIQGYQDASVVDVEFSTVSAAGESDFVSVSAASLKTRGSDWAFPGTDSLVELLTSGTYRVFVTCSVRSTADSVLVDTVPESYFRLAVEADYEVGESTTQGVSISAPEIKCHVANPVKYAAIESSSGGDAIKLRLTDWEHTYTTQGYLRWTKLRNDGELDDRNLLINLQLRNLGDVELQVDGKLTLARATDGPVLDELDNDEQ